MVMRPKKPRFVDGVQLVDNLYPDNRGRPGYWRYRKPDGRWKGFQATTEEACRMAEEANAARDTYEPSTEKAIPRRDQMKYHVPIYTQYRERISPALKSKKSWSNRKYALGQFAREFDQLSRVRMDRIREWWDELSYSQQKLRMAEFRRFFNWLMAQGLVPQIAFNPFTTADDVPRLLLKEKPLKQRPPCTEDDFWQIYKKAPDLGYEALQIGMGISRYTGMREADVCALRFDTNVVNNRLRVIVAKSEAQKGSARAARLEWDLEKHQTLRQLIKRARELALQNNACPFVVSHKPARRRWNGKEHLCQVLPRRLYDMFVEVRDACEIPGVVFHEIRGLTATLLRRQGYTLEEIRRLLGQEHVHTTAGYIDASDLPHEEVHLKLEG